MLNRAVAAVKQDKAKALDMFNEGEGGGGFKDRDLYVFCASASDGILTAHPTMKAQQLREFSERRANVSQPNTSSFKKLRLMATAAFAPSAIVTATSKTSREASPAT